MKAKPGVPHWLTQTKVLRLFQQHGLRPLPLQKDQEELLHVEVRSRKKISIHCKRTYLKKGWGCSIGIQLAHPGYQHGPADPSEETHHVAVDPVLLRPELDTSQGQSEVADIWHLGNSKLYRDPMNFDNLLDAESRQWLCNRWDFWRISHQGSWGS